MSEVNLEIVKIKGAARWAQKATYKGESRYRVFYYKFEAQKNLPGWELLAQDLDWDRNFYHNFDSAEDLGITEVE